MHVQQIWHPIGTTAKELLQCVHYSCTDSQAEQTLLRYASKYYEFTTTATPAQTFEGALSGGAYHNGSTYTVYVKGLPDDILQRCVMSEGEREKATLEYLHLEALGLAVVAFGRASAPRADAIPRLDFVGYVALH